MHRDEHVRHGEKMDICHQAERPHKEPGLPSPGSQMPSREARVGRHVCSV